MASLTSSLKSSSEKVKLKKGKSKSAKKLPESLPLKGDLEVPEEIEVALEGSPVVPSKPRDVVAENLTVKKVFDFMAEQGIHMIVHGDYGYVAKYYDNSKVYKDI